MTHAKDHNSLLPATELAPSQRLALWSALLFLQTVLPGNDQALTLAAECGMHRALGPLVKLVACWAAMPAASGMPTLTLKLKLTFNLSLTLPTPPPYGLFNSNPEADVDTNKTATITMNLPRSLT